MVEKFFSIMTAITNFQSSLLYLHEKNEHSHS